MDAMILAAGAGTRLWPLTDRLPKALVPVRGRPLLGHVMDRLVAAGATRLVVNTCHHSGQIADWLAAHTPPGVEVALSYEPGHPYDTGGGLMAAAHLFREGGPILLHAVDVLSEIPLEALVAEHRAARLHLKERLVATLAVQQRTSSRRLLFDDEGLLGWRGQKGERRVREPAGALRDVAFAGIHVIEPALLGLTQRRGTFPIVELYLDLAERGYVIRPVDVTAFEWLDVGTPQRLREAEARH
ncbi:MAG: hypothetical protein A2085_09905 [Gemmatimonadetes bacterium GWC2_71_10]|nr:MAG: hypothetical protein A2085_09905 [Gemmatimonadetes bacterium GWC2_71_10]